MNMKLKSKIVSGLLSAVLVTGSTGAAVAGMDSMSISASAAAAKLAAPAGLKAKAASDSVTLSWNTVKGASGYRVFKYNADTKKYVKVKDVTGTRCKVTGLKSGTSYKFKVTTLKKSGGKTISQSSTKPITAKTTAKKAKSSIGVNVGTDNSIKITNHGEFPVTAGYYDDGKWITKSKIEDFTYENDKSSTGKGYWVTIRLKGETLCWDSSSEDSDEECVNVSLYDSEGYVVDTKRADRDINSKGKFKNMSVEFYYLQPGKYTLAISDYGYGDKPSDAAKPDNGSSAGKDTDKAPDNKPGTETAAPSDPKLWSFDEAESMTNNVISATKLIQSGMKKLNNCSYNSNTNSVYVSWAISEISNACIYLSDANAILESNYDIGLSENQYNAANIRELVKSLTDDCTELSKADAAVYASGGEYLTLYNALYKLSYKGLYASQAGQALMKQFVS